MLVRTRVSAVSYLNTCPLTWGMLHGPQVGLFDLRYELPSQCARSLASGDVAVGLVPVIEAFRQNLQSVADVGIWSDGAVRSIFLLHRCPVSEIRTVAMDSSSRTSAALARILLAERYGIHPSEREANPDVAAMLADSDAAVIIGDPALKLDLTGADFSVMDLGEEWRRMSGLPMVYAIWAGQPRRIPSDAATHLRASYDWGRERIGQIVDFEAESRGLPKSLAQEYLTRYIRYEFTSQAYEGMRAFERLARAHSLV